VEPRLERPQGQGASPGAPPQELRRPAPPPGPPPPPPPPPPPLERPLGRGAAPEGPHQAVRPPVPPSFPPPALPLPPPPLERLQGRGAAPAALHTRRLGREGRHRTRRPCHRLHPRRRRGRHRMDPLGMTWGTRGRPAGGWCTREEEMEEGSCRGTIADPPANRRAEAGGPQGGLGVSCRRRREMS